jgi:hypothetical protein
MRWSLSSIVTLAACSSTPAPSAVGPVATIEIASPGGEQAPRPAAAPAPSADAGVEPEAARAAALREAAEYGAQGLLHRLDDAAAASPPPPIIGPHIEPAIIQSIVRGKFDALRRCYEAELAKEPTLIGRVTTRFQIGVDGKVSAVSDAGSDPAMAQTAVCVRKGLAGLVFPVRATGKPVTVVYPIVFAPGA